MVRTGLTRSNWKLDGNSDLGQVLVGSNIIAGSFFPAAAGGIGGASFVGGGFIMGSFASQLSGVGFVQISALGALSAFYGTGNLGGGTSGYKFIPFAFEDISGDGASAAIWYALSTTQAIASNDSTVVIKALGNSGNALLNPASNRSVHFTWAGWIISVPAL